MSAGGKGDRGAAAPSASSTSFDPALSRRLRVVGYNVRDLLDDRASVAHVVRSCRPDVLCLQEAPRRLFTTRRTAALARETNLRHVVGGRGSGGTAVLVSPRLDLLEVEAARLPVSGRLTRTRGYALATVALPQGARLTVLSVHLPLRPDERVDHSRRVVARLRELARPPYVVAADLNETSDGPSWTAFAELVQDAVGLGGNEASDAPTYPAKAPRRRIDGMLLSQGVRVLALRPAGEPDGLRPVDLAAASDHLPLVADLELEPDQPQAGLSGGSSPG